MSTRVPGTKLTADRSSYRFDQTHYFRATMLSALARRAVPATAIRLSSATAAGGARRAMGSAQSFVSFGAAVRCVTSCSEATDAVQFARTLPTVSASETSLAPVMCVLAGIWAMESSGYCTVDGLHARGVLVRSQSLTIHLSILSFS